MHSILAALRTLVGGVNAPTTSPPVAPARGEGLGLVELLPEGRAETPRFERILGKPIAVEQNVVLDSDARRARVAARASLNAYVKLPNYRRHSMRLGLTEP